MSYGKHTSQANRTERKIYSTRRSADGYEGRRVKSSGYAAMTPAEIDLFVKLFGITPLEAQALKMAGLTLEQASIQVDTTDDAADDAAMYNDLRNGG